MKGIKFRAWEKNMNSMIPVENIDFLAKQINTNSVWRMFHEIELMQYTGRKDENGVDVYEGDRVKDLHNKTFTVKYNDFYAFMLYDDNGDFMAMYPGIKIEVIGNIYENESRGM